ncbi:MAG TPA: hydrogenase expression/formation protein HypE [Planctomycetaceae bacterium]|nr:hydrogenase expression/formation protein HypE [Planctomycetaceae bacterium]
MPDELSCPMPQSLDAECVTLAYGEGGRLSRRLVQERLLPRFGNPELSALGDAAVLTTSGRVAFTTDSYTVTPLFFPGGDIGRLAVYGTVNDLAVSGATPRWLSLSLMIEEGLTWTSLDRVLDSIQVAAKEADVLIVTGDTKVVPRGAVDQLFITTAGIGEFKSAVPDGPAALQPGDVILVSGPIGQHGAAILCAREDLGFEPPPLSDCANLAPAFHHMQCQNLTPRAARDATRGGVAAVLHEWSTVCGLGIDLEEQQLPVGNEVSAVCELLGLDPLFLACEGTFVAACPEDRVNEMLTNLHKFPVTQNACVIGRVVPARPVAVCVRRAAGRMMPLDEPAGSPLPRIC